MSLFAFIHKGFKDKNLRFFLINRTDINSSNDSEYRYGTGFYTSIFTVKQLFEKLSGIIEIRNEYRMKDKYMDLFVDDSGSNLIILSPQLNYMFGNLNVSAIFDYPLYGYYFGHQLAIKLAVAINLTYQLKLF